MCAGIEADVLHCANRASASELKPHCVTRSSLGFNILVRATFYLVWKMVRIHDVWFSFYCGCSLKVYEIRKYVVIPTTHTLVLRKTVFP